PARDPSGVPPPRATETDRRPAPGPLPADWPPPIGQPVSGSAITRTRTPLPPGRPDFEPPPPWAEPQPPDPNRSRSEWTPLAQLLSTEEPAPRRPRFATMVAILVAGVLVTSAASAAAGAYFGPRL